jgi:ADP-ribosylglycohydrolase
MWTTIHIIGHIEMVINAKEFVMNKIAMVGAWLSLEGLSLGDAFGEMFFQPQAAAWLKERRLPPGTWHWTDDTHMALSIVENLAQHGRIEQDALAQAFAARFREEPWRGYAGGAVRLLQAVAGDQDWRDIAPRLFPGGSYGNGGAMRAAPIGGFFAGDPERAAAEARRSAVITHAHPEGQAGAMAVAAAAAIAAGSDCPTGEGFLTAVLPHVPHSKVKEGVERAREIAVTNFAAAVSLLGTGSAVSAQDTVPYCLWRAAHHLDNFEEALWQTAAGYGDVDTTCAIVGGIVALSAGKLPADWLARREPLPALAGQPASD